MKTLIPIAAALAGLALSGCATPLLTLNKDDRAPVVEKVVDQFGERCAGHYWGSLGVGGTLGFDVKCVPPNTPPEGLPAGVTQVQPLSSFDRAVYEQLLGEAMRANTRLDAIEEFLTDPANAPKR